MATRIRVLVVDDFEPWRRFVSSTLQQQPRLHAIAEVSDGLDAIQKAKELQPDLILLDIGLPSLNGIEAAKRILESVPNMKILFVSENRSRDIVEGALRAGACGYVLKSSASRELLPAIESVLQGKQYTSDGLIGHDFSSLPNKPTPIHSLVKKIIEPIPLQSPENARHHEAGFYSDDRYLLDHITQFIGAGLKAGNSVIVAATESHRKTLLPRLQAYGLDIAAVVEQGRYIPLDAADTLSTFMVGGRPDPVLFMEAFANLILAAAKAAKAEHPRVEVFGECVNLLWAEGNAEAAIQMEKLGNQLAQKYDVDILCGYSLGSDQGWMDRNIFQRICAEHSTVYAG